MIGMQLTVADIEDLETVLGIDFGDVQGALEGSTTGGRLRIMAALVWVYRRKSEPAFTFEDARALPPDTLTAAMESLQAEVTEPDPTSPPLSEPASLSPGRGDAPRSNSAD